MALLNEFVPCHICADSDLSFTLEDHFPELLDTPSWSLLYAESEGHIAWFGAGAGAEQHFGQAFQICKWLQTPGHDLYLKARPRAIPPTGITDLSCVLMVVHFRIHNV